MNVSAQFDPIGAKCRKLSATAFSVNATLANLEPDGYHNLRYWFQRSIVDCADRIIALREQQARETAQAVQS